MTMVSLLARLRRDCSGMAFIEFAFLLPIGIPLTIVGMESANLALTDLRVSQAATMVADNVARVRDRIDEADVNNIMLGAKLANSGIDLMNKGRIVVTTVEDNDATPSDLTDQKITWQRCKGVLNPGATPYTEGQIVSGGVGTTGNKISPAPRAPVILVEVSYQYQPMVPAMATPFLGAAPIIRYRSAFTVRDRADQAMQNGGNLSGANIASCSIYASG